jgi:hypothetical protein
MVGLKQLPMTATISAVALALLAAFAGGCGSSGEKRSPSSTAAKSASSLAPIRGHYSPSIDPTNFVSKVDNRYWPLEPGTAYHNRGVRGTTPQTDD